MPVLSIVPSNERDILEPMSSEQARSAYLEIQMQGMSSARLPLDMPLLEDMYHTDLQTCQKRIQTFCQEWKEKRKHEWESLKNGSRKR